MADRADRSADRRAVEKVNTTFYEAFESADIDTMQDLWLDDPETLCVHPGALPVRGTSAINRSWALIMANTPYIQFFLTDVDVKVFGDVAVVRCVEGILTSLADTDGDASVAATNVFVRAEDGWRLWVHHGSPVVQHADADGLG
jgi:uncharacterized protein (TIGR02246 family)